MYYFSFFGTLSLLPIQMQNGALVERGKACDIMVQKMESMNGIETEEGRTKLRQLIEKCYDDAKTKAEKYEIAGTLMTCIVEGTLLEEVTKQRETVSENHIVTEEFGCCYLELMITQMLIYQV